MLARRAEEDEAYVALMQRRERTEIEVLMLDHEKYFTYTIQPGYNCPMPIRKLKDNRPASDATSAVRPGHHAIKA